MALDCLIGYIGLKTCVTGETPASGLYINSLAGISLDSIEAAADAEARDFLGSWETVEARGAEKFAVEFEGLLQARYNLCSDCLVSDLICDNIDRLKIAYWYYLGVELLTERLYTDRLSHWTIKRDKAKELRAEYEIEYQTALKIALDNFPCGDCLEDDPLIGFKPAVM